MHTASNTLVAARTGSPLIVGVLKNDKGTGEHGYFIASDIPLSAIYRHRAVLR